MIQQAPNQLTKLSGFVLRHMINMPKGNHHGSILLSGDPGIGKAQPLTAKILTPSGWVKMGDIKLGDMVVTPSGINAPVSGVYPQGVKDIYTITFHDGSKTKCCLEHLWKCYYSPYSTRPVQEHVLSTQDLIKVARTKNVSIPLSAPIQKKQQLVEIDPYVMGVLLGDGSFCGSSITVTSADRELVERVQTKLDPALTIKQYNTVCGYDYGIVQRNPTHVGYICSKNSLTETVQRMGLKNLRSHEKFIPELYMNSSITQRFELLKGLMDTDGTVTKQGRSSFTTTSEKLAKQVQQLVWSLGGCASMGIRHPTYTYKEEKRTGRVAYEVMVALPHPKEAFSLTRKRELCREAHGDGRIELRRRIKSIEKTDTAPAQCIMINHPDHLYITDDYIVTHNTTFVDMFGALLGMKVITIEVPHVTEEHLINIPFIVFDPKTNTSTTKETKASGPAYRLILADSNLYSQLQTAVALSDQEYLQQIVKAPAAVQTLYKSLGGTADKIPPVIMNARRNHKVILFLDEFYRSTSTRIRNLMRGMLNGNIGKDKIPRYVYQMYASNMKDNGLDSSPNNYQFTMKHFEAPSSKDWFKWLIDKYEEDKHIRLDPQVMSKFKSALTDEDISYTDAASNVRTSPRRWEQLLMYINASIPPKSVKDARALITNVKNNFVHYQPLDDTGNTTKYSTLGDKVLAAVYELIKDTSSIEMSSKDELEDHEWRDALDHAIQAQMDTNGKRKHIPVVSGPPGIGKTTQAATVAKDHNLRLIEIDCAPINSDDAIGMPIPGKRDENHMEVQFSLPALYERIMSTIAEKDKMYLNALVEEHGKDAQQYVDKYKAQPFKYLIFFDEMNRVSDEKTFNALRRVILEKNFGEVGENGEVLRLPKDSIVVGAINPSGSGTTPFTDHMRDVIDVIPAAGSWTKTKKYMMANEFNEPDTMKTVAMDIIEAFAKKFKTTNNTVKAEQAPFHLLIGGSAVYLAPREYNDLFATLIREVGAAVQTALEDPDVKENEIREYVNDAVFEAMESSLNFPLHKEIGMVPEEFMPTLRKWIQALPDSIFGNMLTKKAVGINSFAATLGKYLDGHDLTQMPEDEHFGNANDSSGDAQIMEEIKTALRGKIVDDASVQKYILDAIHPQVVLQGDSLAFDSGKKVPLIENLFRALIYTLHIFDYANNRLNASAKSLSQTMSELNKTLVKDKKISEKVGRAASNVSIEIRGDLHEIIEGLE
jgi:hypothetical protein